VKTQKDDKSMSKWYFPSIYTPIFIPLLKTT